MKKHTLKTIACLVFATSLALQLNAKKMTFGAAVGLNATMTQQTNLPDDISNEMKMMASYNINGYCSFQGNTILGFSLEPGFIQKGGLYTFPSANSRFEFNYIQLPILVDIHVSEKLYISAGTELSYMISAKSRLEGNLYDISSLYNKTELSGMVGLQYTIIEILDIGVRYNHGITSIQTLYFTNPEGTPIGKESKLYNQYFQLIARFKLFHK